MKRRLLSLLFILLTVAGGWLCYTIWPEEELNWSLTSFLVLLLGLGLFYFRYERAKVSSKEVAVIASLVAIAVVGRMIFAAFPNFKPTTCIIILAGYAFGPRAGFMVGATTAVVSNMFFMQGPWTLWQMVAWGLIGAAAGVFGRLRGPRVRSWEIALFGLVAGFGFGWVMNTWVWLSTMYPLNFTTWVLANSTSLLFDIAHAASNVLFAFLLTRPFLPILMRFQKKLTTIHLEVIPDAETTTKNS